MSIDDERGLYQRLDQVFGTITPRPAPVDGAMRRGRTIRRWRRSAAAAGLAAVAAAGVIGVPSLKVTFLAMVNVSVLLPLLHA